MKCVAWRACENGILQGFADIEIEKWGTRGVVLPNCKLFMKNGHRWVTPPSNKYVDGKGEEKFSPSLRFIERADEKMFSDKAIEAIECFCKSKVSAKGSEQIELPF